MCFSKLNENVLYSAFDNLYPLIRLFQTCSLVDQCRGRKGSLTYNEK